tara:strand:- start:716 stop:1078 length:363 start_codon:yes stop_codon:yes gene_type:complete
MDTLSVDTVYADKIYTIQTYLSKNDNKYFNILSNIIDKHNLEHSSNMNGIFLNLSTLSDMVIDDIYINFINNQSTDDVVYNEVKKEKKPKKKQKTFTKETITLDKFDKYLLQLSRTNISI